MSDPQPTPGGAPYRRTKVFISYRRRGEAGDAERLYDELSRYFSRRHLFLDVKSIGQGDSFPLAIQAALEACDALLAAIGPRWLTAPDERGRRRLDDPADMVRREVAAALARGVWVIPVLLHGARMPAQEELPDDLKPLAECQAVEIRSGHFEKDVRELVGLLKRRLYRRRRLAAALSFAAALAVVAAALYRFATVPLPVDLKPDGGAAVPRVYYHSPKEDGQEVEGEEGPQEMVVEGLSTTNGEVFTFDGQPVTNIRVDFNSARFREDTIRRFELNPEWGNSWKTVTYAGVHEDPRAKRDFNQACPTSATVVAADAASPPTALRFFQESRPEPRMYREFSMRADRDLAVNMDVQPSEQPERGPGCSKFFRFGGEPSKYKLIFDTAFMVARTDASFALRFLTMDNDRTSPRDDLLRLGENDTFDLRTTGLRASRVVVRARRDDEVPCGDKSGRAPTVSFEARSADGKSSLLLRKLEVGADYFTVAAEGSAYVVAKCEAVSPGAVERVRLHTLPSALLLAAAAVLLGCLVYAVVRL